jgi:hypothetical protein
MKPWQKLTIIGIAIAGLAGTLLFYYATKKTATAADSQPIVSYTAPSFISAFEKNTDSLHTAYMLKNVGVEGTIKSIDNKGLSIILDGTNEAEIICTFDSIPFSDIPSTIQPGNSLSLKGIYYGHNGFDAAPADPNDLLAAIQTKSIKLRTCAINKP